MLEFLPAVIEPADDRQMALCNKFPGVHKFKRDLLPLNLKTGESSFEKGPSFIRFIKSLATLAANEALDLESYTRKYLTPLDLEDLQNLVLKYTSSVKSIENTNMKSFLKSLPILPGVISQTYVTAADALATKNLRLLVPWTLDFERFINPSFWREHESTLKTLGVKDIPDYTLLRERILPRMPDRLRTACEWGLYGRFTMAISKMEDRYYINDDLRKSKLAPDRNGVMHTAGELLDHQENIFTSAYRAHAEEDNKFLLKKVENYRQFWMEIGLAQATSGQFPQDEYILCLRVMRERLESCKDLSTNSQIIADAYTVLQPIVTDNPYIRSNTTYWSRIAREALFPAMESFSNQPIYRVQTMNLVATAVPLLPLVRVFASKYIPVCWSQTSFPMHQPTTNSFHSLLTQGKPPTEMAWRHLEHMTTLVEGLDKDDIQSFLSDLSSTYGFLQDNLDKSRTSFTLRTSKVWLNLDIIDAKLVHKADLQSSWCDIDHLVLSSSCDIGMVMSVREALMPFEKLLAALGCEPILYPTISAPEICSSSISNALKQMRTEGKLLDVTLVAEEGKHIRAHKVVLASASAYFATQFNGNWSNNDIIRLEGLSHSTMAMIVDFAYEDNFDWTAMQVLKGDTEDSIADKLDTLLDLLDGGDRFVIPALTAQVENQILQSRKFIRQDNVRDVRDRASQANARLVERLCLEFIEKNQSKVNLAYENGA